MAKKVYQKPVLRRLGLLRKVTCFSFTSPRKHLIPKK